MNLPQRTVLAYVLIASLAFTACGPGQLFGPTLTPTPTATSTPVPTSTPKPAPAAGLWKGTTSENNPVSFEIPAGGNELSKFTFADVNFFTYECGGETSGTLTQTTEGPFNIINDEFSFNDESYSFSGKFTSTTAAAGTFEIKKITIKVTGPAPAYLLKDCTFDFILSGTWTAEAP